MSKKNWPEYLMEAAELAFFMFCGGLLTALFESPSSPVFQALPNDDLRRFFIGVGIGLVGATVIYSPFGKQSGAHFNPAVTFAFYRLGKIKRGDALFYVIFQCWGGLIGVSASILLLGSAFTLPPVDYTVTQPGDSGWMAALLIELVISFILMLVILFISNSRTLSKYLGALAGCLLCCYVYFAAPISGFGMNPARSFASAFFAESWMAFWVYIFAPIAGMLIAAELYRLLLKGQAINCAKLGHHNDKSCIFNCNYQKNTAIALEDLRDRQ